MKASFLVFSILLVFAPFKIFAQDEPTHILLTEDELQVREQARRRHYLGGVDEDSIVVQTQLPNALMSAVEDNSEPDSND